MRRLKWKIERWLRKRDIQIESLNEEITLIKKALEKAFVCNFIWVTEYKKGMKLRQQPTVISLENLLDRIRALERAKDQSLPPKNEYHEPVFCKDCIHKQSGDFDRQKTHWDWWCPITNQNVKTTGTCEAGKIG